MKDFWVCAEIHRLDNMMQRYIKNRIKRKDIKDLSETNGWIIGYIFEQGDEPVYQRDIEQTFNVTRSTASKVVNLLVKKGYIIKESVLGDARLRRLVLTEKSEEIIDYMTDQTSDFEKAVRKGFTDEEIKNFLSYIDRMKRNIEMD